MNGVDHRSIIDGQGAKIMQSLNQRSISPYVNTSFVNGIFTVHMTAENVGEREASVIASAVHRALQQHGKSMESMVLDVSSVRMMQSIGLGMCIDLRNTAKAFGVATTLRGLAGRLEELFAMMKIDRMFESPSGNPVIV
jgi:anti-anti-sigma factor